METPGRGLETKRMTPKVPDFTQDGVPFGQAGACRLGNNGRLRAGSRSDTLRAQLPARPAVAPSLPAGPAEPVWEHPGPWSGPSETSPPPWPLKSFSIRKLIWKKLRHREEMGGPGPASHLLGFSASDAPQLFFPELCPPEAHHPRKLASHPGSHRWSTGMGSGRGCHQWIWHLVPKEVGVWEDFCDS